MAEATEAAAELEAAVVASASVAAAADLMERGSSAVVTSIDEERWTESWDTLVTSTTATATMAVTLEEAV